jgi:hypothetical protein
MISQEMLLGKVQIYVAWNVNIKNEDVFCKGNGNRKIFVSWVILPWLKISRAHVWVPVLTTAVSPLSRLKYQGLVRTQVELGLKFFLPSSLPPYLPPPYLPPPSLPPSLLPSFLFSTVLEFELMASHLLSSCSVTWANPSPFFFFLIIHLFTCAYIVWDICPPVPRPHPLPSNFPRFQAEPVLPLYLILLKRKHKQ